MRLHSKFTVIALVFVPVVVFLAYNSLSASSPNQEPLAAFAFSSEAPSTDFIPAPVVQAPKKAWTEAVRSVLEQVEQLESRLELYSAQLEAIESERVSEEVGARLDLDETNPGKALEQLLNDFDGMVNAWASMDDDSKAQVATMDEADRVSALTEAARAEVEFNAYLDKLATIRAQKVAAERDRTLEAFEGSICASAAGKAACRMAATEAAVLCLGVNAQREGKKALAEATEAFFVGSMVEEAGAGVASSALSSDPEINPPSPLKDGAK